MLFPRGKNVKSRYHVLLQGILPTRGLNLGLPHCGRILHHLSHHMYVYMMGFPGGMVVKNLHSNTGDKQVCSQGGEDPLE